MFLLIAIGIVGGLGLAFGIGLGFASRIFAVETDPRVDKIYDLLPHANCGACGFPGCDAFASAIVNNPDLASSCTSSTKEVREAVASILGVTASDVKERKAQLFCRGGTNSKDAYDYDGIESCAAASLMMEGPKTCKYGCLGFGDCVKACPFNAISMAGDGYPEIDVEKCTGCGVCVEVCPKSLFRLMDRYDPLIACSSQDKGALVSKYCTRGCIACNRCVRACEPGAITMENNLAVIDYDKCTQCYKCIEVCPRDTIVKKVEIIAERELQS
jgi:Na+-translocating ferredoxin:NAD+ oxidoreductase RNF subunit RnfB